MLPNLVPIKSSAVHHQIHFYLSTHYLLTKLEFGTFGILILIMIYQQLKDNLFSDIHYPKEVTDLIGDAEPWRAFCSLPQSVKNKFIYKMEIEDLKLLTAILEIVVEDEEKKRKIRAVIANWIGETYTENGCSSKIFERKREDKEDTKVE